MSRLLITFGIVLIAAGLLWPLIQKAGLGRLPGSRLRRREFPRLYPNHNVHPDQHRAEPCALAHQPLMSNWSDRHSGVQVGFFWLEITI